jgi:formyltetrahydrofolate deformylase
MLRSGLILKLSCPDQPGIVAKIASYVAGHRGNLIEFAQFTDKLSLKFFARLEIETGELDVEPEDFIEGFGTLGRSMKAHWHFRKLPYKMRTAVLVTKTDHCLNEILWRAEIGEMPVEITSIIGNRDTCRPIAERAGIPFHLVEMDGERKAQGFAEIREILAKEEVELAVLARFMQIIPDDFCRDFAGRLINIHHSFLPAFIGAEPYRQAYRRGVKLVGATSHYVTEDLDEGPIIAQGVTRVSHRDTVKDMERKGRDLERVILAEAVRCHLEDRIIRYGNKTVVFE